MGWSGGGGPCLATRHTSRCLQCFILSPPLSAAVTAAVSVFSGHLCCFSCVVRAFFPLPVSCWLEFSLWVAVSFSFDGFGTSLYSGAGLLGHSWLGGVLVMPTRRSCGVCPSGFGFPCSQLGALRGIPIFWVVALLMLAFSDVQFIILFGGLILGFWACLWLLILSFAASVVGSLAIAYHICACVDG